MPSFDSELREIHRKTRADWHAWLEENHAKCEGVWSKINKQHVAELAESELMTDAGRRAVTVDQHLEALDDLGGLNVLVGPLVDQMYHGAWAWAGSAPYRGMNLLASHFGGTRNPMAVRWPAKIAPDPTLRPQFHHCNDVVPTIYQILGIAPLREVLGVAQDPAE